MEATDINPAKESPAESAKKSSKRIKENGILGSNSSMRRSVEGLAATNLSSSNKSKSTLSKSNSTLTRPTTSSSAASLQRRNSTGGLAGKTPNDGKKASPLHTDPNKRGTPETRRASMPDKSSHVSGTSPSSDGFRTEGRRKSTIKPALPVFNTKKTPSSTDDRANSGISGKVSSNICSPSFRSPSVSSSFKSRSLSAPLDKSSLSNRKKVSTPDSRDSRLMMLPQVDIKAGDELRLDLRGHRVRSLSSTSLNLSPNLEFVYLRDNLLSSVEGIEILKRVKVLDLSFNDFKGSGFEPLENCRVLQQLYLAGNQITSLASLPQLPNLEFLSVAQNKLKSLSMASQPRLQVLAASKNKISTLKGFPHLPVLEHLRLEENPILSLPHLEAASILLVGSTLKKFNDRDVSSEELKISKQYPAHTALCIRDGWDFCRPEHASESTFRFLTETWNDHLPPGYILKEAAVDPPFEEDVCRCHFNFASLGTDSELVLKYQWFIGERTPTNFVLIPDAVGEVYWPKHDDVGKCLKVECIPVLQETEYASVFAISPPVSAGTGCPKVVNVNVLGELVEGNVIKGNAEVAWCGGTPGKGVASWLRRRWNSSPVVIPGAEDAQYMLTVDDIDSSLVFMYTPVTEEGVRGEPQYAITDFVKAAAPSVKNVLVLGDAMEGSIIKGVGEYFGGKEGPSKFEWLRESGDAGNFMLVLSGTTEYTLTKEDIGRRLAFVYTPINMEGQEGESKSIMTEIVKQAPPKVTNLKIIGHMREGNKISVTGVISGGSEGSSRVQWFKATYPKLDGENGLEPVSTSKISKVFRIPLSAVGCYIVAKYTPMAADGESGEPAYIISEKMVETLPPSLNFLSITGEYAEGALLSASYGYIGGHEGKSLYNWYLHETEADGGRLLKEASGKLQYRITKDAIGKFVSFKCTPLRDDGVIGEPRTFLGQERVRPGSPRLLSLQILGKAVEGATLFAEKKYWGGEEGDSVFSWFLTSLDGIQTEIKGATSATYTLSSDDIGFLVSVSCEPVRHDCARGPVVVSEHFGPILPGPPVCRSLDFVGSMAEGNNVSFVAEYTGGERGPCTYEWSRINSNGSKDRLSDDELLELSLEDVGKCIELVYTPVRKDGLRGTPMTILSSAVVPANPKGLQLVIPDCYEDTEVIPFKSYYGGHEGTGIYTWYRTKRKLEVAESINICAAHEDVFSVGENLTYTPSLEDVGSYLALHWVPTRIDGKKGDPLVAISKQPVIAAFPVVSNVYLKEVKAGIYKGEGQYYGGHEGSSLYSWYRETDEGIVLINGANSTTYEVTDSDYTFRLLFGYTPVRSDLTIGDLRLSEPSDIILPEIPKIEMLTFKGKEMEGEILTALEVIPESAIQHHVWQNYKKEIKYQWFCSVGTGEEETFEPLPSQFSSSYRVRLEDIGCCLKCQCIVTDVFGRTSKPCSAITSPILPGMPKIDKLEIEGRGFHTNLYAVRGIYSGGREGKSKIQWLRSMVGSPDLISIPGETGRMYEANVDDVGYRVIAIYTPVREDGVEGKPVSVSTDPIAVEPDVYKEVKQKLDLGSVKFEALCDKDRSPKKVPGVGNLERRILEVNKKRVKVVKPGSKASFPTTEVRGTYVPPFHVEIYRNDQHRFKIVVDSENEVDLMVQTRHTRDLIVLVIRGFAQRFNSTSLNSLLKIET